MRRFCVAFIALMSCMVYSNAQTLQYLVAKVKSAVESKWETDNTGNRCLNYYNYDYCDYLFFLDHSSKVLMPGKNTIYRQKDSELENAYKYGYKYYLYRGRFPNNRFNPFFVYALPLKEGTSVEWEIDIREPKRTLFFKTEYRDTVYASRTGVACLTEHAENGVLIYHSDYSFAGYLNLAETLVVPGQKINVGQPIGLASYGGVSFSVFYLDRNLFTGEYYSHPYTHIMPVFRTDEGDIRLEKDMEYTVVIDDELFISEMTKQERKRYIKMQQNK